MTTMRIEPARPNQIHDVLIALAEIPFNLGNAERRKVAERVRLGIARNFTREGPEGMPWASLARRTVNERRDLGYAGEHPILQRTKELKRSWTEAGHPNHVEQWDVSGDRVTLRISSSDPRMPRLAAGSKADNLPPRPQHLLGEDDIQGLADTLAWVVETAAKRGL